MPGTIAITTSNFDMDNPLLKRFTDAGWNIVRNPHGRRMTEDEVRDLLAETSSTAMIAGVEPLTASVFDANPQLEVISRCGSGLDAIDLKAAANAGISIYRTPEAPAEAVAELTVSLAIGVLRRIGEADRIMRTGDWHALMGRSYSRSRIGIAGLGHVGRHVARVSAVLGAEVGFFDTFVDDPDYRRFPDIAALAEWADVLTIHLPHDEDTHHAVDADVIAALGPDGVLINTARGGLVDESALHDALVSGNLAGAALDVFEKAPTTARWRASTT